MRRAPGAELTLLDDHLWDCVPAHYETAKAPLRTGTGLVGSRIRRIKKQHLTQPGLPITHQSDACSNVAYIVGVMYSAISMAMLLSLNDQHNFSTILQLLQYILLRNATMGCMLWDLRTRRGNGNARTNGLSAQPLKSGKNTEYSVCPIRISPLRSPPSKTRAQRRHATGKAHGPRCPWQGGTHDHA
jgi:hypothetical protein